MNKYTKYILAVVVVFLLSLGATMAIVRNNSQRSDSEISIATDPSFTEYEGQLMPGFPEFPVYADATLVGSAKVNTDDISDQGYRVKWLSKEPVVNIMRWYEQELTKAGWAFTPNNDPDSSEQIARISKDELSGYLAAEMEEEGTDIVVDLRKE